MTPPAEQVSIDVEKLIGRLVLEHEMTKSSAISERKRLLQEIDRLKALVPDPDPPIDK